MRTASTFDTLEYMEDLTNGGISEKDATAITKATSKAFSQMIITKDLATKIDIASLKIEMLAMENRLILKLGSIMVGGIGVMITAIKYLGV